MKLFFAFLALLCLSQTTVQAQEIWAKTLITSECASGGMDYYFFRDFQFIGRCSDCESTPYVEYGSWEQDGREITLTTEMVYEGEPEGGPIPPCGAVCIYESYRAERYKRKGVETFTYNPEQEGCESWKDGAPDWLKEGGYSVHGALRQTDIQRDYTQASNEELTEADLTGMSKAQLRIMRNEIFASYGYSFKSKDLQKHFRERGMYGYMSDVSAFLSDREIENIELIQKVERSK